jgi:acyl-CoA thioesterase-2
MSKALANLINSIHLEKIEINIFRGQTLNSASGHVFGGQVLAQAINAAQRTVSTPLVLHSLHAYFLRPGDTEVPIVYEVDRIRDGRSFTTRRVVAIQQGRAIFNVSLSFQLIEEGFEHQAEMPDVPGPEGLKDLSELAADHLDEIPEKMRRYLTDKRPFDFRPVEEMPLRDPQPRDPKKHVWIRTVDKLPDDHALHQNLLAYVSDYELIGTSTLPHGLPFGRGKVIMASLDHALWFHREVKMDEWMLYAMESPNASGARGFARGQLFSQDGKLVASTTQEGLIRVVDEPRGARSDPRLQV